MSEIHRINPAHRQEFSICLISSLFLFLLHGCAGPTGHLQSLTLKGKEHIAQGKTHFDRKEWQQAETEFTSAILKLGEAKKAVWRVDLDWSSENNKRNVDLLNVSVASTLSNRAIVLAQQGDYQCALEDLAAVLQRYSGVTYSYFQTELESIIDKVRKLRSDIEKIIVKTGRKGRSTCPPG